jgi:hypothetical protein
MGEAKRKAHQPATLYHFTFLRHLESIAAEGLRPSADGVVWLTADPRSFYACDSRGGLPLPPSHAHDCRIALIIPSDDKRLVTWKSLLSAENVEHYLRNPYLGRELARRTVMDWRCYLGTVSTECFREIAEVDTCWQNFDGVAP